jgi:hypothetical protein
MPVHTLRDSNGQPRAFRISDTRFPLAYPLVSVAADQEHQLIGSWSGDAPVSIYRVVEYDEDSVTLDGVAGSEASVYRHRLPYRNFTSDRWSHAYPSTIPATTEGQPTMTDLDPTALHPRDLHSGELFVWQNTQSVRSWLGVDEDHVLAIYRAVTVSDDLLGYSDTATGERFTMSLPTVDGMRDDDIVVYRFRNADADTATPAPTTTLLPRTAAEAQRLHAILASVDARADVTAATATLARALPGGELEAKGLEVAQRKSLCDVYERVVTGAFGWAPRPHNAGTDYRRTFVRDLERVERDYAGNPASALTTFAERYARGGVVNEAIADAMENNLEAHKVDDVNEVLDACGFDGMTRPDTEYRVTANATRMVRVVGWVRQTQPVSVYVTASSADEALELAQEQSLHDHTSRYDWETDDWSDISWDIDDDETDDEDEDWDGADVEEA